MKSFSASLVTVALLAVGAAAQNFQINTPNPPTQCVPTQFTWSGGTPPFFLVINPGGQPGAAALQQYPNLQSSPFTWSSNITAGTSISLSLTDSTGANALSAPVTILSGPDSSCLNGGAPASSGSAPTSGSTSAAGTGTTSAGTTSAAGTSTGTSPASGTGTTKASTTGTGTGTSTTASATGGSGSNGALSNVASVGVVGILGAVAAALLA
ncbi:hypothetical protein OH76DRAFT_1459876 [Lentinus brumalis]|uniref:Uncharacterized protein n=1 Tax=Lentinus brumalis TaxID=2498619 RepID=A0A371DXN6_9APHY|nr:hypothetical protein OH76DRAFT_1459876 [Polyporus brumalis]